MLKEDSSAVPDAHLMVLNGKINGKKVEVLKDDGCNTNVISRTFLNRNKALFTLGASAVTISHSRKDSQETIDNFIINTTVTIGSHEYIGNWTVADCWYDVLLGMPWHKEVRPEVDYKKQTVTIDEEVLTAVPANRDSPVTITNLKVKKFRSMLRKKGQRDDFVVYQLIEKGKLTSGRKQIKGNKNLNDLLSRFDDVFTDELPAGLPKRRDEDHCIEVEEGSRPPTRPLYQLSPAELLAVKQYVEELLRKGKIRRSKSPYGSSLFIVKELDKLRCVVDYRALNRIRKKNSSPLPRCDEMFDRLGKATVFSKLDLKTGFHQIRVREEDIEKTAFKTRYGHFEYLVMPMGLRNGPATFQSVMNRIFDDCIDVFVIITKTSYTIMVYMDDLLIFSRNEKEHLRHLEIVLSRLKSEELYVSGKKCSFMFPETEFLGLFIGKDGIKINPERADVVRTWPKPT